MPGTHLIIVILLAATQISSGVGSLSLLVRCTEPDGRTRIELVHGVCTRAAAMIGSSAGSCHGDDACPSNAGESPCTAIGQSCSDEPVATAGQSIAVKRADRDEVVAAAVVPLPAWAAPFDTGGGDVGRSSLIRSNTRTHDPTVIACVRTVVLTV